MDIREEKIRLWLKNPPEMDFPVPVNLPKFSKKSFRNYDEMNAWKQQYLFSGNRVFGLLIFRLR